MRVQNDSEITYAEFINEQGEPVQDLPPFAARSGELIALYRAMLLTRTFDEKAVSLQRTGRLGTYASALGQEAVGVGVASAMEETDILLPSFREQAALLWRGVSMEELLLYWGGDERGSNFKAARRDFPICVPVATHFPHAVGVAFALRRISAGAVAVAIAGDGATSKGDFYEALNAAGVWRLPVVFVINNNQWAISVPRARQTAAETLAHKALAAGIPGLQVDGNDVIAVRQATAEAIERARQGEGPSLIEAVTYRLSDHTTADDASHYRADEDVSKHWPAEPVRRLKAYLLAKAGWSAQEDEQLRREITKEVDGAVKAYLDTSPPPVTSMFDHLFATRPDSLDAQSQARKPGGAGSDA
jgi:pyruvate dehydrogenase E1 component alpha subunit